MSEQIVKRNYNQLRRRMGLTQNAFWSAVKVTQSGGSRYESGRKAPAQVDEMVRLHHVLGIDTNLITEDNADLIRAILNGTLNASEILATVKRCQDLMTVLQSGADDLTSLAANMATIVTGVREAGTEVEVE